VETRYKTSSGRHLILDLHAAALVAALTDASLAETGTGTVQADIRTAGLGQLLRHEQQSWYDSARGLGLLGGQEESAARALRQIIAASCLLGASGAAQACDLVERIPGVSQSPKLAEWLEDVAGASHRDPGQDGFLSLTRLAELHTLRELTSSLYLLMIQRSR
jgi:hypothetical protein